MKQMRKIALLLTVIMLISVLPLQSVSAAVVGEKIGDVLNSDIKAFINGSRIPVYNIANKAVVVASDLANYGFDVKWDVNTRSTSITLSPGKQVSPLKVEENTKAVGTVAFPYVYTDIVAYVNGQKVESYNVQGKTVIYFEALKPYGTFAWEASTKSSKFTVSSSSSSSTSSGKKVGDVLGSVLNTDIKAFINGERIPSYNIANNTVVIAADLANYGFDVVWNATTRSTSITLNSGKKVSPLKVEDSSTGKPGTPAFNYLYTDIVAYVDGQKVESFNVQGQMAIYFSALSKFGVAEWDAVNKYSLLNTAFTVSGKVTDGGTSDALSGVKATLKNKAGQTIGSVTTASDGSYTFNGVTAGTYTAEFTLSEYSSAQSTITVGKTNVSGQNVKMNKEKRTVSGKVFEGNTSAGLSGAMVSLKIVGGITVDIVYTKTDGSYEFSDVSIGTYIVEASMNGYRTTSTSAFAMGASSVGSKNINMSIAGVTLSGTIYNSDNYTGKVSGATVYLRNSGGTTIDTTTTNSDGSYSFTDVMSGYYTVYAEMTGYTANYTSSFSVSNIDITNKHLVIKPSGYMVSGYIYNSDYNNSAVSGATVNLKNSSGATIQTTTSSSNGSYSFTGLSYSNTSYYTVEAYTSSARGSNNTPVYVSDNSPSRNVYISISGVISGSNYVSGYITYNSSSSITITSATMNGSSYGTLTFYNFSNNSIISNAQYNSETDSGSYVYIYFNGSISYGTASSATVTNISSNTGTGTSPVMGTVTNWSNYTITIDTNAYGQLYFSSFTGTATTSGLNLSYGDTVYVYFNGSVGYQNTSNATVTSVSRTGGNNTSPVTGTVTNWSNYTITIDTSAYGQLYFSSFTGTATTSGLNLNYGDTVYVYFNGSVGYQNTSNATVTSVSRTGGNNTSPISGYFSSYSYNGSYYTITLTNTNLGTLTFNVSTSNFNSSWLNRLSSNVKVYFNGSVYMNDASQATLTDITSN